ncbi:MAG: beta-ketoacyl-[acyl-carrier-protein] synthase family protein [Myxococcales bacterium]|nr:beta-ketoacyl-[acyl-carrier-protein] synthase family protein [Myxococcales bacterium]
MGRRVVVTGLGVVSAAGQDVPSFWHNIVTGRPAIERLDDLEGAPCPVPFLARVPDDALEAACQTWGVRKTDRVTRFAAVAARQAMNDAGLARASAALDRERAGVIFGSGLGGLMFQEEQMWKLMRNMDARLHPHSVPRISATALVNEVALPFGFAGPGFVVSSACTSGAHAVGLAMRAIENDEADLMLAGGAEAPLTRFTVTAFSLLGVLAKGAGAPETAAKPFDERRDGFVLGEGAGALVLEEEGHARARGAPIYARLCGFGQSLGAHHPVSVRPDGQDAASAMKRALRDAGVSPEHVGYVNAHGTGTRENDAAESRAMHLVFGARGAAVPISSVKPVTGHALGAAGAFEAIVTSLSLAQGRIPPSANCEAPAADCPVDVVRGESRRNDGEYALSNAFGFGNINVALVFGHASNTKVPVGASRNDASQASGQT